MNHTLLKSGLRFIQPESWLAFQSIFRATTERPRPLERIEVLVGLFVLALEGMKALAKFLPELPNPRIWKSISSVPVNGYCQEMYCFTGKIKLVSKELVPGLNR